MLWEFLVLGAECGTIFGLRQKGVFPLIKMEDCLMAGKKNTSLWIDPKVNQKLRVVGAYMGTTIGDTIRYLLTLVDDQGRPIVGQKKVEE